MSIKTEVNSLVFLYVMVHTDEGGLSSGYGRTGIRTTF